MSQPLQDEVTRDDLARIASTAFLPYSCSLEPVGERFGFELLISGPGGGILGVTHHNPGRLNTRRARAIFAEARATLKERGHKLAPWRFPTPTPRPI